MKEAKVVDVVTPTVAGDGILVQIVVAHGKYQANEDDHESPLLVKSEDKVADLDVTGFEQLLYMVGDFCAKTKQTHIAMML